MSPRYPSTLEGTRQPDNSWRTVSYYSEPVGRAMGFAIIFGVLCVPLLLLAIGIRWLAQLQSMWVLLLLGSFMLVAFLALIPTYFKHTQEGIDHAKISADAYTDARRIDAEAEVKLAQAAVLQSQADIQRRQLELGVEATLSRPGQSQLNRLATFVPPIDEGEENDPNAMRHWTKPEPLRQDPMTQTVLAWAGSVYRHIGYDGRIKTAVPWAERGGLAAGDRQRAQDWLRDAAMTQASGWIVEYRLAERGWYLNIKRYPTSVDLINALSSTPPPRGAV